MRGRTFDTTRAIRAAKPDTDGDVWLVYGVNRPLLGRFLGSRDEAQAYAESLVHDHDQPCARIDRRLNGRDWTPVKTVHDGYETDDW